MRPRNSEQEPERAAAATPLSAHALHRLPALVEPLERIGAGGTAEVWRAQGPRGPLALKVPRDGAYGQLLEHEHAVLLAVHHPTVVATHGFVDCGLGRALALEYLPGGDLVALVGAPPAAWLSAVAAVTAALAHIHACGYAYRDLKPRNVLFDSVGGARLIDFAAALPLGAPQPRGGTTAAYRPAVAPARVSTYEDEYALAVLLYELIAGRLPFGPDGRARGSVVPPPAGGSAELRELGALVTAVLTGQAGAGSLSEVAAVIDTVAAGCRQRARNQRG